MIIPVFDELRSLVKSSGLPTAYIAYRSGVCRQTLKRWLDGKILAPRIDTMLKVATVLGQHIKLTDRVEKMVNYYPRREIGPPPPIPYRGMSRHSVRMALVKLQ